jgi:hypothetical protein
LSCLSPLLVTPSINYNMQLQVVPSIFCPFPCFLVSFCLWNKTKSKKKENKEEGEKTQKKNFFSFTFRFYSVFWISKEEVFFFLFYISFLKRFFPFIKFFLS